MWKTVCCNFSEPKVMPWSCFFCPANNPKPKGFFIYCHRCNKKKQPILPFKKLEQANVWQFCLKKLLQQLINHAKLVSNFYFHRLYSNRSPVCCSDCMSFSRGKHYIWESRPTIFNTLKARDVKQLLLNPKVIFDNTVLNVCILFIMFQLIYIIFQSNVSVLCLKNDSSEQLTIKIVGISFSSLAAKLGTAVWDDILEFVKVTRLYVFNETPANFQLFLCPSPAPCLWQQNSNFMQNHDVFLHITKWNLCLNLIIALAQCRGKTEIEKKQYLFWRLDWVIVRSL